MFNHFLKITFRNMMQNKFFVIINVIGLGVALACVIVAYSFFKFDFDFDSFHTKRDILYKVSVTKEVNGNKQLHGITPISLGPAIKNSISGIDNVVRFNRLFIPVRFDDNIFDEQIGFVDNDFFELFDFSMVDGDRNSIKDIGNILISEKMAGILFKEENPIGKIVTIYPTGSNIDRFLKISGVFKDVPENSSLRFDALTTIDNLFTFNKIQEHSWTEWTDATFLKVSDNTQIAHINEELKRFVEVQNDAKKNWLVSSYYTERFKDIPRNFNMLNNRLHTGQSPEGALFVGILAIIILMLACLNFMNTFLAISNRRLKEIGINKVLGGIRRQSILQFLGESILLCFIALFFALTIAPFLFDAWNTLTGMSLTIDYLNNYVFWVFLVVLLIFTGALSGAYPAFYISSFNPVKILKGTTQYKAGGWLSKTLLSIQFLLAIIGNVAAVLFIQNAHFQEKMDLGYNKENIIVVPVIANNNSQLYALKNRIIQNPFVDKIGVSRNHINWNSYTQSLKCGSEEHLVSLLDVGQGYFETMELQLREGRYFDQDFRESERGKAVIVNEKLVKDYGWETPVGQRLKFNDTTEYNVIGVMKDFCLNGFNEEIKPTILKLVLPDQMRTIVVNTKIENLDKVKNYIEKEWKELIPNVPYSGYAQYDKFADTNKDHQSIVMIFLFIGTISVLLSLVGLYSLISLNIIKKTKEIGIRKVLGAPMPRLVRLISKEFIYIVLIGSVLGSILGSILTFALLDNLFAYHIGFNIVALVIPVLSILIIAIITLSGKIYMAANRNPVESLKYE